MDKQLEERVREAILFAEHKNEPVKLTTIDAKRILYRLKKENEEPAPLIYRRDQNGKR